MYYSEHQLGRKILGLECKYFKTNTINIITWV